MTNGVKQREKVERLYIVLQIYCRIYTEWIRLAYVPTFFATGGAVVLCLYFPVKHSEMIPGILSGAFVYLAVGLVVVLVWVSVDTINVSKASESIIYELRSKPSSRVQLQELRQNGVLKRAKALTIL